MSLGGNLPRMGRRVALEHGNCTLAIQADVVVPNSNRLERLVYKDLMRL